MRMGSPGRPSRVFPRRASSRGAESGPVRPEPPNWAGVRAGPNAGPLRGRASETHARAGLTIYQRSIARPAASYAASPAQPAVPEHEGDRVSMRASEKNLSRAHCPLPGDQSQETRTTKAKECHKRTSNYPGYTYLPGRWRNVPSTAPVTRTSPGDGATYQERPRLHVPPRAMAQRTWSGRAREVPGTVTRAASPIPTSSTTHSHFKRNVPGPAERVRFRGRPRD